MSTARDPTTQLEDVPLAIPRPHVLFVSLHDYQLAPLFPDRRSCGPFLLWFPTEQEAYDYAFSVLAGAGEVHLDSATGKVMSRGRCFLFDTKAEAVNDWADVNCSLTEEFRVFPLDTSYGEAL